MSTWGISNTSKADLSVFPSALRTNDYGGSPRPIGCEPVSQSSLTVLYKHVSEALAGDSYPDGDGKTGEKGLHGYMMIELVAQYLGAWQPVSRLIPMNDFWEFQKAADPRSQAIVRVGKDATPAIRGCSLAVLSTGNGAWFATSLPPTDYGTVRDARLVSDGVVFISNHRGYVHISFTKPGTSDPDAEIRLAIFTVPICGARATTVSCISHDVQCRYEIASLMHMIYTSARGKLSDTNVHVVRCSADVCTKTDALRVQNALVTRDGNLAVVVDDTSILLMGIGGKDSPALRIQGGSNQGVRIIGELPDGRLVGCRLGREDLWTIVWDNGRSTTLERVYRHRPILPHETTALSPDGAVMYTWNGGNSYTSVILDEEQIR